VPWSVHPSCGLNRHLDWDGLTSYADPIQLRIAQIKVDHEQQIRALESQLAQAKAEIMRMNNGACGGFPGGMGSLNLLDNNDEVVSLN